MIENQNRDANRWQEGKTMGIRVTGTEYQKMEYMAKLRWCFSCKKRENRFVSKRWHPSFSHLVHHTTIASQITHIFLKNIIESSNVIMQLFSFRRREFL